MPYSEDLAVRIRVHLEGQQHLVERKMFGGICFMVSGNMCCGVAKEDMMVRVGPGGHEEALTQPGARPMDITGRPMKGFVLVGPKGTEEDDDLKRWVDRGVAFAKSLPAK